MPRPYRRKARVVALQTIYSRSRFKFIEETEVLIARDIKLPKNYRIFAQELIVKTWKNLGEIDRSIGRNLINWKQTRLSETLSALLRIGTCELIYFPHTDAKVVFNESIELCKTFVGKQATKICNGVLNAVWEELQGEAERTDSASTERISERATEIGTE